MSPEYTENERRLQVAARRLWRIEDDRRVNGTNDEERERAHAAAIGSLAGYHFRDAELFWEERGMSAPKHFGREVAL